MSNHLAIATVSAVLKGLLHAAIADVAKDSASLDFDVATGRPEKPTDSKARITLFLYQVTPNAAWRNADLPARRSDGTVLQRPQAAVDLHYLISFAGEESKQVPEQLLGIALTILHAQPILNREMIRKLIGKSDHNHLSTSNLADQIELIRLVPLAMTIDELSKLWSVFFQIPYHLSVAWQASVVLLDIEIPAQTPLPVQARNLYVETLRRPVLDEVIAEDGAGEPIFADSVLLLRGRGLKGNDGTEVWIGGAQVALELVTVTDSEIRVQLGTQSSARAGIQGVQVIHPRQLGTPPTAHRGVESNAVPIVLRPEITTKPSDPNDPDKDKEVDARLVTQDPAAPLAGVDVLEVPVEPLVKKDQRVSLLLTGVPGQQEQGVSPPLTDGPKGYTLRELPRDADGDPKFDIRGLDLGRYAIRVQVDGAESLLEQGPDGVFDRPWLEIPIS